MGVEILHIFISIHTSYVCVTLDHDGSPPCSAARPPSQLTEARTEMRRVATTSSRTGRMLLSF